MIVCICRSEMLCCSLSCHPCVPYGDLIAWQISQNRELRKLSLWNSDNVDDDFLRALSGHSCLVALDIANSDTGWNPESLQFLPTSLTRIPFLAGSVEGYSRAYSAWISHKAGLDISTVMRTPHFESCEKYLTHLVNLKCLMMPRLRIHLLYAISQ